MALSAGPVTARTLVDFGPVAVEADLNRNEGCTVGIDEELCAAVVDTNGTLEPGDDDVWHDKSVDELAVYVRESPASESQNFSLKPGDLVVEHPLFSTANESWSEADATLPAATDDHASLDSSRLEDKPGDEVDSSTWGLSLNAHPAGVGAPRLWVLCWDITCGRVWWGYFESEEGGLYFTSSVLGSQAPWDSDPWLEGIVEGTFSCLSVWREIGCPENSLSAMGAAVAPAVPVVQNATPEVHTFSRVNGTAVHVGNESASSRASSPEGSVVRPSVKATLDVPSTRERTSPPVPEHGERSGPLIPRPWSPEGPSTIDVRPQHVRTSGSPVLERAPPVAMLATVAGSVMVALVLILLYTRMSRDRVLAHATRKRVYDAICSEPGIRVGTVAARLGLDYKTALHHVKILRDFSLVKTSGSAGNRLLPVGHLSSVEEEFRAGVLANVNARSVYDLLQLRGPLGLNDIAAALGLTYVATSAAGVALRKAGLVDRERQWRRWVLQAKPFPKAPHPLAQRSPMAGATRVE